MTIKTGDNVRVLTGKDKGKQGKVLQVFPKLQRVVVEGVNLAKRHLGARGQAGKGQIVSFPAPLHASNVMIVSPTTGKVGRLGVKLVEKDGAKTRVRVLRSKGKAEELA